MGLEGFKILVKIYHDNLVNFAEKKVIIMSEILVCTVQYESTTSVTRYICKDEEQNALIINPKDIIKFL